jgi:EAL domain-containing protein (putative c-di-GMP-specific phosphodiesterase class I)
MVLLHKLKNLGVSIVLDDFGTGFSSLSYLVSFPFDKLKIDKSFTQEIGVSNSCRAVVSSALSIAQTLDLSVTAEGVETKEQWELLRANGATFAQGYFFGRPMNRADFVRTFLNKNARWHRAA